MDLPDPLYESWAPLSKNIISWEIYCPWIPFWTPDREFKKDLTLGPNDSGKSTLLSVIVGQRRPTSEEITATHPENGFKINITKQTVKFKDHVLGTPGVGFEPTWLVASGFQDHRHTGLSDPGFSCSRFPERNWAFSGIRTLRLSHWKLGFPDPNHLFRNTCGRNPSYKGNF